MPSIQRSTPTSENIFVDLYLSGEFWDRPPEIDVLIDNQVVQSHVVDQANYHIRFRHVMSFGPHRLQIRYKNKTNDQTRQLANGEYQSQLVHIDKIKLDNIDLRNIVWHTCRFQPEYPEPWASQQLAAGNILEKELVGEIHLGHNGLWTFEFTSPIYMFLVGWTRGKIK